MPNRLQHESSPYLLQHANNPVDWYPWGEEAFARAIAEDKPVLVSIGYAACHWCHVMERESFENEETASVMNERFINIKIDREERPDLDHIYMDAVQAMSGSGGWPLNVFLTPGKKPFYGGTYFPPRQVYNRPSWTDVLTSISDNFREKRQEIEEQANNLTDHITKTNGFGVQTGHEISTLTNNQIRQHIDNVLKSADTAEGGFGRAPKFPQSFTIRLLLLYYYHSKDQKALDQALLSLNKMIDGGIYDQLGGGFARYSTDDQWLAPHFEKMLYDNALLIEAMAEAFQLTGDERYSRTIAHTVEFLDREMTAPGGGWYSALDADSEGVEGKFYTWSFDEIGEILGDEASLFNSYYGVVPGGNWEHTNILHVREHAEAFSKSQGLDYQSFLRDLEKWKSALLQVRAGRIRPQLDDKILLGWNALMNIALSRAAAATGISSYRERAVANMDFILNAFTLEDGSLAHNYKNNIARNPAFLDDYAYLIEALIRLQEVTGNAEWLKIAKSLTEQVLRNFSTEDGLFFYTPESQTDVILRKKEIYDGAVPSGNAVMLWNLYQLGVLFDQPDWRERALKMAASLKDAVLKYPGSFGVWARFQVAIAYGIPEIAIIGGESTVTSNEFLRTFIGSYVFQSATLSNDEFPLLAGKPESRKAKIFLCKDYACQAPVETVPELVRLLGKT